MEAAGRPTQGGCCRGEEERGGGAAAGQAGRKGAATGTARDGRWAACRSGPEEDAGPEEETLLGEEGRGAAWGWPELAEEACTVAMAGARGGAHRGAVWGPAAAR